jgi:hypothetical protein
MNQNSRTILLYTGRAIVVIAALALVPATAHAQTHGGEILKACTSPVSTCNSDADCDDGLFSNGAETCSTPSATEPTNNCTIQYRNVDDFLDDLLLQSACDVVKPGTPEEIVDCTIAITFVEDNPPLGDTTCVVAQILGAVANPESCILGDGDRVHWVSDNYLILVTDANVVDQGQVQFQDLCNGPAPDGCDPETLNTHKASFVTTVTNNCQPGCPPDTPPIICLIVRLLGKLELIKDEIILLPGELFPAPGNRQALLSGLDTVQRKIEDQKFDDAGKALDDLRKHLDGCESAEGTPDSNDWISDCAAQTRILSMIDELIADIGEAQRRE